MKIFFLTITYLCMLQTITSQRPIHTNPIQAPTVSTFSSFIELCDETKDIYLQFQPTNGYNKLTDQTIEISSMEYQIGNRTYMIDQSNGRYESVIYNQKSSNDELDLVIIGYDVSGSVVSRDARTVHLKRDGMVRTSDHLYQELKLWRNTQSDNRNTSIIYHFCGKNINKVELLAFFQEFLELTEEDMCKWLVFYETTTSNDWENTFWDNFLRAALCDQFNDFLNSISNPQDGEDCNCKIIKSQGHLVHSLGQNTSADGSSAPQESCPEVYPREGSKWWGKGASGQFKLDHQNNWTNILWANMGAAKMFHMHGNHDRSENDWKPEHDLGLAGELKSRMNFSMYCYDPSYALIDGDECGCEKLVKAEWEYSTKVSGYVDANGSGKIAAGLRDFVAITRNEATSSQVLETSLTVIDLECQGTDTIPLFLDLINIGNIIVGGLPTGLVDSALTNGNLGSFNWQDFVQPGVSALPELATAIDNLIFADFGCADPIDTTYISLKGEDVYTLTPENYEVGYTISSGVYGGIRCEDDESETDLGLLSRFYMAGALLTPDPDTVCCNEALGSYIVGNFSDFDNDNLGQSKFNGLFDIHHVLTEDEQASIASFFKSINPLFLEDMFPVDDCCLPSVECMYGCGYWSDCASSANKNELTRRNINNLLPRFTISPNPVKDYLYLTLADIEGNEDYKVEIINYKGQKLLHMTAKGSPVIDTSTLPKGAYIIKVSNRHFSESNKFIKL